MVAAVQRPRSRSRTLGRSRCATPGAAREGEATRRVRKDAAPAGLLGLGAGGGTFTLLVARPAGAGGGSGGGVSGGSGAASGPQLTTVGRTGSGHPDSSPVGDPPLSSYGAGIPVAGDAGLGGLGRLAARVGQPCRSMPTAAIRVAAPQAADVAPEADPVPVISSADNAPPPSDPAGTPEPSRGTGARPGPHARSGTSARSHPRACRARAAGRSGPAGRGARAADRGGAGTARRGACARPGTRGPARSR